MIFQIYIPNFLFVVWQQERFISLFQRCNWKTYHGEAQIF